MSLKDLFNKNKNYSKITENLTVEEIGNEVESIGLVESYSKISKKTITNIDWEDPSEFARYGQAEKYYEDAFKEVYKSYPYDGSKKEKIEWEHQVSDLTVYVFENLYPRQNGYITIGYDYGTSSIEDENYYSTNKPEYISFRGTMNVYEDAEDNKEIYDYSNKFSKEKNRTFNLYLNGETGNTVEFYYKSENYSGSHKQVIFDLWNSSSYGNPEYGRYRIETHPGIVTERNKFYIEFSSGSAGELSVPLGLNLDFTGSWHQYSIQSYNEGNDLVFGLYVDGVFNDSVTYVGSAVGEVLGGLHGQLGSLLTSAPNTSTSRGWGKLSGSIDEFRYWKTKRTDKQIYRNHFCNVYGGTNTDDSNTDLGLYYKFNEGIATTNSDAINPYDKNVLDYSGRMSNGTWTGYSFGSRNTGSALILSKNTEEEFKDPIVYPKHYQVLEPIETYKIIGREYDTKNHNSMYNTIPSWIKEEDEESGRGIENLTQIMSEFFDDLYLKIKFFPSIKTIDYANKQNLHFNKRILANTGLYSLDILNDSNLIEEFLTRTEDSNLEERFYKIRSKIYKNIYNNIISIYKSKGTSKSIRNLLHCFGIDERTIKTNLYANDLEYKFEDRYNTSSSKRKSLNFNEPDRFTSTIYQKKDPSEPNSRGYLKGSSKLEKYGFTLEASAIFPKKFSEESPLYFLTNFLTSSIAGVHESTDGTWAPNDDASFQIYAIRNKLEGEDCYFALHSSCFEVNLTSSLFRKVYNNEKWNFSVSLERQKNIRYPVSGSEITDYILKFYGVNTIQDIKQNSFLLTASVSEAAAEAYFACDKMIYAGAHRTNYTGSTLQETDMRLLDVRYWNNVLSTENIDLHSKNVDNFSIIETNNYHSTNIRNIETLALYWNFEMVTGSDSGLYPSGFSLDSDAGFYLKDISSGSLDSLYDNFMSEFTKYQHSGRGDLFLRNINNITNNEYVSNAKTRLPEVMSSDDLTYILSRDDEIYGKNTVPINHYFSIEKSMYQIFSEEMLNWIGTVKDFNDLIGNPRDRYSERYESLDNLRQTFFRNVESSSDFDTFLEVYKWIDESVFAFISQLIPASLDTVSADVFNIYESHILERKKYKHKLPSIEFKGKIPESPTQNHLLEWYYGRHSLKRHAEQEIYERSAVSRFLFSELKRRNKLVYTNFEVSKLDLSVQNQYSILVQQELVSKRYPIVIEPISEWDIPIPERITPEPIEPSFVRSDYIFATTPDFIEDFEDWPVLGYIGYIFPEQPDFYEDFEDW